MRIKLLLIGVIISGSFMEEVFHVSPGLSEFYREAQNRLLAVAG